MSGRRGQCGDEGVTLLPADADLARRIERCARARNEDPADVLDALARYGLTHYEDALD